MPGPGMGEPRRIGFFALMVSVLTLSKGAMKKTIHRAAGLTAFVLVLAFFLSTIAVELVGGPGAVAVVKRSILYGLVLLVPAMAAVGGTGMGLAGTNPEGRVGTKKRRMPVIALNGVVVLIPSAVVLDRLASAAFAAGVDPGPAFYAVQAVELAAGAVNFTLMAMNIRDGLAVSRTRRGGAEPA